MAAEMLDALTVALPLEQGLLFHRIGALVTNSPQLYDL